MKKIYLSMMAMAIAAFTFTACEDVPEPYNNPYNGAKIEEPVVIDPTGSGTAEDPYNVAGINEYAKAFSSGQTDSKKVFVTGIICNVANFQEKYGEIDYYISDDKAGLSSQFYVYGGYGLNGEKFTSISELAVGDTVTVEGTITNYNNTLEFKYGSKIISLKRGNGESPNPITPDVKTVGSKDAPKTVAEALTAINALADGATSEEFWYIKGVVTKITTNPEDIGPNSTSGKNYSDINYYIANDVNGSDAIQIYRGMNLDNTAFTSADQLKVGDEVIVYGKIMKFINSKTGAVVPEVAQGNYLVKHTEGSGDQPGTPDTPSGDNLLTNGDFETWSQDSYPDNWKTTTTAGNATLSKSSDAHGGTASVQLASNSSNKRLGYKEITLKAGTYTTSFYAKCADEGKTCSVACGYASVAADNSLTYVYKQGADGKNEYASVGTSSWTEITNTFTLAEDTKLNLIVMNAKNGGSLLIDDFTLTTSDGGLVEEGGSGDDSGQTAGDGYKIATTLSDGNYIIAARLDDSNFAVATPIAADKTYNYLQKTAATYANSLLNGTADCEFTIKAVEGGYTIQDATGRYYYNDNGRKNYNVTAEKTAACVWNITVAADGTLTVKSTTTNGIMLYDTQYNSFGCYTTESTNYVLPILFKK